MRRFGEGEMKEDIVNELKIAEQQFRLACTVNFAVGNGTQPLDTPIEWRFGRHIVRHDEFGLRNEQAEFAATQLEMTATMVLAGAIKEALVASFNSPKNHADPNVVSAYQISRNIRNAFSHNMLRPKWSIDADCKDKIYSIEDTIILQTKELNDRYMAWQDYGGPLAMFRFCRFVREKLLGVPIDPKRLLPPEPAQTVVQLGRTFVTRVSEIPPNSVLKKFRSDEKVDLGGGFFFAGKQE